MITRLYQIIGTLFFCFYEKIPLSSILSLPFFPYKKLLRYPPPERLRRACENLGVTFIKLGQMFSTRIDLLPPEYIKELQKLQDSVPPLPLNSILPKNFLKNFEEIQEIPIGSGSVAQVHKAKLKSGKEVAVKIIKPGVEKVIKTDIKILKTILSLFSFLSVVRELKLKQVAEELETILLDEIDLSKEASYLEMFKNFSKEEKHLYIPEVIWKLSNERILVTEFVKGTKLVEFVKKHETDKELAENFVKMVNKMVFEFNTFHGDLHPGNIFITENKEFALVDFGIVGRLSPDTASHFLLFSLGVMEKDPDIIVEALERINVLPPNINIPLLKREILKFLDKYYNRPLSSIDAEKIFYEELSAARKFKIVLPEELVTLMKTIAHTESIARLIFPDFRLLPLLKPYLKKLLPKFVAKEAQRRTLKTALFVDRALNEVTSKRKEKTETNQLTTLTLPALIISYGIILAFKPIMLLPFIIISFATYKVLKNS